jgi:hypothetical protein
MNRCPVLNRERQPVAEGRTTVTSITVHGRPFSPHAVGRCGQMQVDLGEVVAVLDDPDCTYPGSPGQEGRRVAVGRGLAVVFSEADATVITVLWDRRDGR